VLQRAVAGLFTALAAWRKVGVLLALLPDGAARRDADAVLRSFSASAADSVG
jgi:hypothetical protein